jgi:hypothetical protein
MTSFFARAFATLRTWLGINDPVENRLYPAHGWLLPEPAVVRMRLGTPVGSRRVNVRFEGGR